MELSTNLALSELAIYAMSGVLIVAMLMSGIAAFLAIRHNAEVASESLKEFFNGGNALKIITVFAVVITAAFLALAGQLSEGAIALLSSISGYVLGSMQNNKQSEKDINDKNE